MLHSRQPIVFTETICAGTFVDSELWVCSTLMQSRQRVGDKLSPTEC